MKNIINATNVLFSATPNGGGKLLLADNKTEYEVLLPPELRKKLEGSMEWFAQTGSEGPTGCPPGAIPAQVVQNWPGPPKVVQLVEESEFRSLVARVVKLEEEKKAKRQPTQRR